MLTRRLNDVGLRGWHLHIASLGSIALCIGLWIRAKTVDQDERGNAERRALFVGLWPPMFWLIGDSVEGHERRGRRRGARPTARRALPVAEGRQQLGLGLRRDRVGGELAQELEHLAHLAQVHRAALAAGDVRVEARAIGGRQRALEVVGDQLDQLLAGEAADRRRGGGRVVSADQASA